MSNFSEKLKDILSKKGITPYRLSQISGIRQSTLSAILNGVNTPSGKTLQKICNALDVSMAEFDDTPPTFSTNEKTATQLAANDLIKKRPPAESPTDAYADAIFDAMSPEEKEKRLSRFIRSATVLDGQLKYELIDQEEIKLMIDRISRLSPEARKSLVAFLDNVLPHHK